MDKEEWAGYIIAVLIVGIVGTLMLIDIFDEPRKEITAMNCTELYAAIGDSGYFTISQNNLYDANVLSLIAIKECGVTGD